MAKASELGVSGVGPLMTLSVLGSTATGLTATGAAATTALQLGAVNNFVATTAAATGVMLPTGGAGDFVFVMNRGANSLTVYPPTGATVNNAASFAVAAGKGAMFFYATALVIEPLLSA